MTGYEIAQYLSQCYLRSRLIYIGIGIVMMLVFSLLYLRKKKDKVKGKKKKEQHAKTLQYYLAIVAMCGIAIALSIPDIIPCWQDNRQSSFICVEGTYERDFVTGFEKHPITIATDNGDLFSLYVAFGYSTKGDVFSKLPTDEAFPQESFKARVYYGEHSGLAFYMERLS